MKEYDIKELEAMIPSATVRDYVLEKGWDFTDREKACLLINNRYVMWNKLLGRVIALRDDTNDEVLKEKLTQYLNSKERELQELKENDGRQYIYVLKIQDDAERDYFIYRYFIDYKLAYEHGMEYYEEFSAYSFRIDKCPIYGTGIPNESNDEWGSNYVASYIVFTGGEIYDFDDENSDYDYEYFDFYFEVPNPFEQGDTVKIIDSEECGVVGTSQKSWAEDVERRLSEKISYSDYTDILVYVSLPDENGLLNDYDHISPLYLERYQSNRQS